MLNVDSNMAMQDPRQGFVLSTDDPVEEETKGGVQTAPQASSTTLIDTTGAAETS